MSKQIRIRQLVARVSLFAVAVMVGIMAALIGMGTSGREVAASSLAGVTCIAGLSTTSPDYATCRSAVDSLKVYGIETVAKCVDPAGNDLGCRPINTDDIQLVLAAVEDMVTAMGLKDSGPQAFKDLLKLGPNEYVKLEHRSYNGSSGFTQQPWDFFAIDFDVLHGMLQGPGQAEAWIKDTAAHEMYHVLDGRYDFAYARPMHTMGYYDSTPQQEDMSNPKPGTGVPVSDHGASGPYDDYADAGAAEMYAAELEAVYVYNYAAYEKGSMRSNYVVDVWQNKGLPVGQGKMKLTQLLRPLFVVQAPNSQAQTSDAANLPVYPGAQNVVVTSRGPNRVNRLYFETPDAFRTVYVYYERVLPAAGWTEAPRPEGHPRLLFTYPSPGEDQPWNVDLPIIAEVLKGGGSGVSLYTHRWPDASKAIKLPGSTNIQVTQGVVPGAQIKTLTLTVTQETTLTVAEVETYLRGKLPEYGWVSDNNSSITAPQGLRAYFVRVVDVRVQGGKVTVRARSALGGRTEVTIVTERGELEAPTTGSSVTGGGVATSGTSGTSGTFGTSGTQAPPGMPRSGIGNGDGDLMLYLLAALSVMAVGVTIRLRSMLKGR
jgi:hypothetical protein